ncbi:MAG: polysaccharide biosynthesis/export family protein [Candidatus Sericytochromatia bacterium]|nr:polysaccharide biosynthesis/export family protein [Candidatus Sericytochromatia bacterium]
MNQIKRALLRAWLVWALVLAQTLPAQAAYMLDFGDTVAVTVREVGQFSGAFPVQPDGTIVIPFLVDLPVKGLTTAQVRERLTAILEKQVHNPQVAVSVSGYRPRTVTVIGEVGSPGMLVLGRPDQSVIDTIAAAGGFTDRAIQSQVVLIRGQGDKAKRTTIDVEYMMATGDLTNNVRLEPGDRLQVTRNPLPSVREVFAVTNQVLSYLGTVSLVFIMLQRFGGQGP